MRESRRLGSSITYVFLPLLSDSWVGLTGFTRAESAGEDLASGAGALAGGWSFCAHNTNTKKNNASGTNRVFFNACLLSSLCSHFSFNANLLFANIDRTAKDTLLGGNVHVHEKDRTGTGGAGDLSSKAFDFR